MREAGLEVVLVRGRSARIAPGRLLDADLVWIAVPDPALSEVEARVASALPSHAPPVVAHASGALGPGVLAECRARGAPVAAAHPVISFGSTATGLAGATFVLDGDPRAMRLVGRVVRALGARACVRPVHGPRYHAALAMAANGAASLASAASAALLELGFTREESSRALSMLLASVATNVGRVGPDEALTGPIARGDTETVARHLSALEGPRRDDYVSVARLVLRAARARGLPPARARAIEALLDAPADQRTRR